MATTEDVENVVVFVSDALRFDFLPAFIRELGVTAKAVAPSTLTASSVPSLTTGEYPATHRSWMFNDQLQKRPELLTPNGTDVGFDAETVWLELPSSDKPPLQINHVDHERQLDELEPPFTHYIHDVGPHAPYGFENGVFESTKAFFRNHEKRRPQLVSLYRQDCRNSARRFLDVYDQLVDRDLLEETLVIFTSDHGQALGEWGNGGRFGHGHPLSPETVYVPIVFMGAGLPAGETYPQLLSGTDIAPTALSAQRNVTPTDVDGTDLWRGTPDPERKVRCDVWQHLDVEVRDREVKLTVYAATSAWNDDGGFVFSRKSPLHRLAGMTYDNLFRGYSPAWRHNFSMANAATMVTQSLTDEMVFGTPEFSAEEAKTWLPDTFEERSGDAESRDLSEEQRSQLRDLGYLS
ncbi:sulfatase-like hydrolase/transferase [Haloprofundus salilacus]|uniref:sulfatase-like hydrolase/transferase n=1 Tax=Haloprofundus salilacus TaxID=2876190 RepID=UPI001CCE9480|nr:sulfatase-like hydrolase/transferase [Haloprofundus salilacus]